MMLCALASRPAIARSLHHFHEFREFQRASRNPKLPPPATLAGVQGFDRDRDGKRPDVQTPGALPPARSDLQRIGRGLWRSVIRASAPSAKITRKMSSGVSLDGGGIDVSMVTGRMFGRTLLSGIRLVKTRTTTNNKSKELSRESPRKQVGAIRATSKPAFRQAGD
jgi:hypothetical protein